jgi:hypothetical protein
LAFDLLGGYSTTTAVEFYAEGFNVFHGNQVTNQARLLVYARDLYDLLERESVAEHLPVPNRNELMQRFRDELQNDGYPLP